MSRLQQPTPLDRLKQRKGIAAPAKPAEPLKPATQMENRPKTLPRKEVPKYKGSSKGYEFTNSLAEEIKREQELAAE